MPKKSGKGLFADECERFTALLALTPREASACALVAKGHTNKEIATQLGGISAKTVEADLRSARRLLSAKLGVAVLQSRQFAVLCHEIATGQKTSLP